MVSLNEADKMLTITELSQILNVHINTVRRWSNQGIIKTYRIGPRGDRRFRHDDVTQFLSGNKHLNT
jgi:excisionase family DNA binding protein